MPLTTRAKSSGTPGQAISTAPPVWENGTVRALPTFGGEDLGGARSISQSGVVGGFVMFGRDYTERAVLWDQNGIHGLGILAGWSNSWVQGVNNVSHAVGGLNNTSGADFQSAFLWQDGVMRDLNDLIPVGSGWQIGGASDINNQDWITGWGVNSLRETHALILVPDGVPEPCSLIVWSLLGASGIGVGWRRKRAG